MIETPSPDFQWATNTEPDFLVLQFPPVPVFTEGRSRDAMKTLFAQRGFQPVAPPANPPVGETDDLDLRPANGCALTRLDSSNAELLLTIGDQVDADLARGWRPANPLT